MQLREENNVYDYIFTHVDDLKVIAKNPMHWIDLIAKNSWSKSMVHVSINLVMITFTMRVKILGRMDVAPTPKKQ